MNHRNIISLTAFTAILLTLNAAHAADVKLLLANPIQPAMEVLAPQFQQSTKNHLAIEYSSEPDALKAIEGGETFDVAIRGLEAVDALIRSGKLIAGSRTPLARFGFGIAVRAGAAKPSVGSMEGLKQTLLNAASVSYGAGVPATTFMAMLARMGISDAMKPKLRPDRVDRALAAVVSGGVELGFFQTPVIAATQGIEIAGALPQDFQDYIVLTAALSTTAQQPAAGQALIDYLMSSEAAKVFTAKGYELIAK